MNIAFTSDLKTFAIVKSSPVPHLLLSMQWNYQEETAENIAVYLFVTVNRKDPILSSIITYTKEWRHFPVIPNVGITRCVHTKINGQDTAW